jgi:hypothetical protein
MALTTPPTAPASTDGQAGFEANSVAFFDWAEGIPAEINTAITGNISMTSTTSLTIGTGSKSLVLTTDTPFFKGCYAVIHSAATPAKWMAGIVTDYVSTGNTTRATEAGDTRITEASDDRILEESSLGLTISINLTSGHTDTLADWNVIIGAPPVAAGVRGYTDRVVVKDGNDVGSSSTRIRRFTTLEEWTGDGIIYADSATLAGTFTIAKQGWYAMNYSEAFDTATTTHAGISVNSSQLTTSISSITITDRILSFTVSAGAGTIERKSGCAFRWLNVGDVVRAHVSDTAVWADFSAGDVVRFEIARVDI